MKKKEKCNCNEEVIDDNICSCGENCTCNKDIIDEETCSCGENCTCNEEEILILKDNIEHLEEKIKLTQAELINYRKRKDEETANLLKYSNVDLILEILPVLDNFERAFNSNNGSEFDNFLEGFKLIYNHIKDTLNRFGVEEIICDNCEFDPNLHEALMVSEDRDKENDIILEVFSKGYILKGRVIRPAKVKVNKIN